MRLLGGLWKRANNSAKIVAVFCFLSFVVFNFIFFSKAGEEDDLTISSDTTWSSGTYAYRDITITNNAILTLAGSYTGDEDGAGVVINARNITIENGSSISANGQGYAHDAGPGKGYVGSSSYGSGAAHGGNGAAAALNNLSQENTSIYGVAFRPTTLGSGGALSNGGAGGGAIVISCSGSILIDGAISANGLGASGAKGGGGSGGSISLEATSVIGSGSLSTIGGNGISTSGSGGGGGRISVYYSDTFSVNTTNISTAGGTGYSGRNGDYGTVIIYNYQTKHLTIEKDLILYKNEGIDQDGLPSSDGNYYLGSLSISNNANLYPQSTYTDDTDGSGIKIYLSNDLNIDSGSKINAKGGGYIYNNGPGTGQGSGLLGGGAGHGGLGGNGNVGSGGIKYGDTLLPTTLGSGGHAPGGGSGGGAVYLEIEGDAIINGDIDASGNDSVVSGANKGSGGSGGSIFIRSSSISGDGNIFAKGGAGLEFSGGGGGGRIALYSDTTLFPSNQISTAGGLAGGEGFSQAGENGTIFIYDIATGDVTASNDVTFEATQGLNPDGSFRNDGVYYFNNFTVSDNAVVTLGSYYTDETDGHGVSLHINENLIVESGSKISADGQGYESSMGQGKGLGGFNQSGSGASYGGNGGSSYNPVSSGSTYGEESAKYPYLLGSGGGTGHDGGTGGNGGGAITIRVLKNVQIDGEISANGTVGSGGFSSWTPGGGSGGSIFITCDILSGEGVITANGGAGLGDESFFSGAGGGGRISVIYNSSLEMSTDNITADGGSGSSLEAGGSAGSVETKEQGLPSDVFSLKNPNNGSTSYTNSTDVSIEPEDLDVNQYSENGVTTNLVPTFYDDSWQNVEDEISLPSGEGQKTVQAWLKNSDQQISGKVGQASIVLDVTQPELTLTIPPRETELSDFTITGKAFDVLSGINKLTAQIISFNSPIRLFTPVVKDVEIDQNDLFEAIIELNYGKNQITLSATDNAGNSASELIELVRTSPPDMSSSTLSDNADETNSDYEYIQETANDSDNNDNEISLEEDEYFSDGNDVINQGISNIKNSALHWLLLIVAIIILFLIILIFTTRNKRKSKKKKGKL